MYINKESLGIYMEIYELIQEHFEQTGTVTQFTVPKLIDGLPTLVAYIKIDLELEDNDISFIHEDESDLIEIELMVDNDTKRLGLYISDPEFFDRLDDFIEKNI